MTAMALALEGIAPYCFIHLPAVRRFKIEQGKLPHASIDLTWVQACSYLVAYAETHSQPIWASLALYAQIQKPLDCRHMLDCVFIHVYGFWAVDFKARHRFVE
jgi:hypothetical protein